MYDGNLTIMRWHFFKDSIKDAAPKLGFAAVYDEYPFYRMCTYGTDQLFIYKGATPPCTQLDMPIVTGFVANGQFYLFGQNHIYSFPELAYENPGSPARLKRMPYSDFIQCDGLGSGRGLAVEKGEKIKLVVENVTC